MQATGLAKYIVDKMARGLHILHRLRGFGQSDGRQFSSARVSSRRGGRRRTAAPDDTRTSALVRRTSTSRVPT